MRKENIIHKEGKEDLGKMRGFSKITAAVIIIIAIVLLLVFLVLFRINFMASPPHPQVSINQSILL